MPTFDYLPDLRLDSPIDKKYERGLAWLTFVFYIVFRVVRENMQLDQFWKQLRCQLCRITWILLNDTRIFILTIPELHDILKFRLFHHRHQNVVQLIGDKFKSWDIQEILNHKFIGFIWNNSAKRSYKFTHCWFYANLIWLNVGKSFSQCSSSILRNRRWNDVKAIVYIKRPCCECQRTTKPSARVRRRTLSCRNFICSMN